MNSESKTAELSKDYRGSPLGAVIKDEWELVEIDVGHIDNATEKAMEFNGTWIPKSLIYGLIWSDSYTGDETIKAKTVKSIVVPAWFAKKEGL